MKPYGTPTVEEVCAMMEQLQSWERKEVAERFVSLSEFCSGRDISELRRATGYYIYTEIQELEPDIDKFTIGELIDEIVDRLSWVSIFKSDRDRLLTAINNARIV